MLSLPVFIEEPLYEYRLTLAAREYILRVDYNGREDRWYLALESADGTPISGRRKIVCGKSLLRHCHHLEACPPGEIFALDLKGTATSPGAAPSWAELGRRVTLFYDELGAADADELLLYSGPPPS
jgi:hypothetical protein